MVHAQPRIRPGEWDAQTSLGFWDTNGSPNLGQTTRPSENQQKKRTCRMVDFVISVDLRVKIKDSEKRVKYIDLARQLKKTMEREGDKDTNCVRCTWESPKGLVKRLEDSEIRGKVEIVQTIALLRILRRVLKTCGDLLPLQWETTS